jgi:hypothetical protein
MLDIISAILDISSWSELNAAVESDWWRSRWRLTARTSRGTRC